MKRVRAGKRGTSTERVLGVVGVLMWATWVVLNGFSLFSIVFGSVALAVSIVEYRKWQRRERHSTGRWEDRFVYPRWAWFAVGAVPSLVVVSVVYGVVLGIMNEPAPTDSRFVTLLGIVPWIVGGFATERLLVRAAERREEAERSALPPMPPPPPGKPPAAVDEPGDEEGRRRQNQIESRPNPNRNQDPRAF